MNKLKVILSETSERCFKLKLCWKHEEFIFAASYQKQHYEVAEAFYIFAKIIKSKLVLMGKKPLQFFDSSYQGIPESILKNSLVFGRILKKSRVLGRWT